MNIHFCFTIEKEVAVRRDNHLVICSAAEYDAVEFVYAFLRMPRYAIKIMF